MAEFKVAADMLGVKVDISSAGALQESLRKLREACKDDASREVSQQALQHRHVVV